MAEGELGIRFTAVDDAGSFVEYEDGRVKPATVLKATGTNIVVFAFDAGSELREHHANGPILLQVLEGAVSVQVDGQSVELKQGGLLHIEATVPHSVTAAEQAKLQLMILGIDSPGETQIPLAD